MRIGLRLIAWLMLSWCVMTVTHECGHLVGGWLSGATLQHAEVRPWHLPHSHFSPDPLPLVTLWAGPLLGVIMPLVIAVLVRCEVGWFVADFCLLANGAYLATAWFSGDRYLDTQRLLDAGAGPISIGVYCLLTIGIGYARFRSDCLSAFHVRPRSTTEGSSPSIQG